MPVTPAHVAAVLPLRGLGLPMSALVLGSMVPDAPIFATRSVGYGTTHSWWGVLTVDLVLVMVGLLVWFGGVRDALVDLAPDSVRLRLPARSRLTRRQWVLVPAAAVIGATTHVAWDAFSHGYGWGTARIDWLQQDHAGLEGFRWVQYVSGVLGLAVVVIAAGVELWRRGPVPRPRRSDLPASALPAVVLLAAVVGLGVAITRAPHLHLMLFSGVVAAGASGVVLVLSLAAVWHLRVRR